MKAHGGELEIFSAQEIGRGHEEDDRADAAEEQEWHRDEIDDDRQQCRLGAFHHRQGHRQCAARCFVRVVGPFHVERDLVDEKAADQRRHHRHQEHRSDDDTEPYDDRDGPGHDQEGRVGIGAQHGLRPGLAEACQPDQGAVQRDPDDYDQHQG